MPDRIGDSRRPAIAVAALLAVVVGAMILSIAAAHVRPPSYHHRSRTISPNLPQPLPTRSQTAAAAAPRGGSTSNTIGAVLLIGALILMIAGLVLFARLVVRIVRSIHFRRAAGRTALPGEPAPDDLVRQMSEAVDEAIDELDVGGRPAGHAIIRCWQRLVEAAAEVGIAPVPSDTPEEAVHRVFSAADVSAVPLRALAELYREARFSEHTLDAADVSKARGALNYILGELGDLAPAHAPVGEP